MSEENDGFNIELSPEIAEGIYSNLSIINHSNSEFVLDFIQLMPGVPKGKVKSRIVLSPQNAKKFATVLLDNITSFEKDFGKIQDFEPAAPPINMSGPKGLA